LISAAPRFTRGCQASWGHESRETKGPFDGNFRLDIDTGTQDHSGLGCAIPSGATLYARRRTGVEEGQDLGLILTAMRTEASGSDISQIARFGFGVELSRSFRWFRWKIAAA
jgi:hypothetical protein